MDYKEYLSERISSMDKKGRGVKLKLAEFLNCKTAFVSQVFNQDVNFSMEQGVGVNEFFNHSKAEGKFFMLLLQLSRAGSENLRIFFREEITEVVEKRNNFKERLGIKDSLDEANQHIYYSTWYYAAIHIMLSIPEFQNPEAIADRLRLPINNVHEALEFLIETGLASQESGKLSIGKTAIFLDNNSLPLKAHLANWRQHAIVSMDKGFKDNLHFSNVISISKDDIPKIDKLMSRCIDECWEIIKNSPEEEIRIMNLDFFSP